MAWSLDEATEFLFGEPTDWLQVKNMDSDVRRLLGSFDSAMRGIHSRWLLGKFRFLLGHQWGYKKACEEVHEVIEKYIDRAMCKHRSSVAKGPVDEVPRKCVLLGDLVEADLERSEIRDQVLGLFFPARDTTAIAIGNIFFYLARDPRFWTKLCAEVLAVDQPLTFEYLKSLKYLRCVINEGTSVPPPLILTTLSVTLLGIASITVQTTLKPC